MDKYLNKSQYKCNDELKKIICNEIEKGNKDILTNEDFEMVYTINLNYFNIEGEKINYTYDVFKYFTNLRSITLNQFIITDEIVDVLNAINSLKRITFDHCRIESTNKLKLDIQELVVNNSICFNFNSISNKNKVRLMTLIGIGKIDIKKDIIEFNNIEYLQIYNCNVLNIVEIEKLKKLKTLELDGSNTDNNEYVGKIKAVIPAVSFKKEYHETF